MNYHGKKVALTGHHGFIGSALWEKLNQAGAQVQIIEGDLRNPKIWTDAGIDYSFDYLFHFAAPSSQVLFKRMPFYCADVTISGFLGALHHCNLNGIKLIYPSTGLLSSETTNEYARCKKVCEDIHLNGHYDALGLRIFASYGVGEGKKRDYASVPYLFGREMASGRSPVIYGDGKQVRDLIYIEDVVKAIMVLAEQCNDPIIDIGSGQQVSFLEIVRTINDELGTDIVPEFIEKPGGYVQETLANIDRMQSFGLEARSYQEGIKLMMESLKVTQ